MSTDKSLVTINPGEWVTQAEAARLRNVSRQAIGRLVEKRRLRTLSLGGRILVNRLDVLAFQANPAGRRRGNGGE